MGKKQLQWKVKGMKKRSFTIALHFPSKSSAAPLPSAGLWHSLGWLWGQSPMAVTGLLTRTLRGQTTPAVNSSGAGAHPVRGHFCTVSYLNLCMPQGNFAVRNFSLFLYTNPAFNSVVLLLRDCGTSGTCCQHWGLTEWTSCAGGLGKGVFT